MLVSCVHISDMPVMTRARRAACLQCIDDFIDTVCYVYERWPAQTPSPDLWNVVRGRFHVNYPHSVSVLGSDLTDFKDMWFAMYTASDDLLGTLDWGGKFLVDLAREDRDRIHAHSIGQYVPRDSKAWIFELELRLIRARGLR